MRRGEERWRSSRSVHRIDHPDTLHFRFFREGVVTEANQFPSLKLAVMKRDKGG